MVLTPEQIQEYRTKYNIQRPNSSTSSNLKGQDLIKSLREKAAIADASKTQTNSKKELPLLTKDAGTFGKDLKTATEDVITGGVKAALRGTREITGGLQNMGQRVIAGFSTPGGNYSTDPIENIQKQKAFENRLKEIKETTGFKSLDEEKPEGQFVTKALEPSSQAEKVGGYIETAAEAGVGFVKGAKPLLQKGSQLYKESKVAKSEARALESITPKTKDLTPTEYEDLLLARKITPKTATKPSEYLMSEAERARGLKYKDLLQSKDPVKNSINVMEDIALKDKQVGQFLKKNNGIYNSGELKNFILNELKDISDVAIDPVRVETLKNTMIDNFLGTLKKNDMESLWEARKKFDQAIEKAFSGSPSLQKNIKKAFRNSIQDFIAEKTPEGVYKGYMKEMRELFEMHDTIATKAAKEKGKNAMQIWIKNNPGKAKVIGWGTTGIVGNEILKATTGFGI